MSTDGTADRWFTGQGVAHYRCFLLRGLAVRFTQAVLDAGDRVIATARQARKQLFGA